MSPDIEKFIVEVKHAFYTVSDTMMVYSVTRD